jgi:serine/threonine protein kinase
VDPKPLTGTKLAGRYDIGRMIGGGGMGHVYEATHSGTGRKVAIKVISTGEMAKDAHIVGRFQREAKAAGSVDSQNICQVLDTGTDDETGAPFMVMEYMTGEDVQQLLQRVGPLSPDLALRITAQAALGLSKAHGVDVVHRDMKPANLYLAKKDDGEVVVKLLDFGIAKVKMEQAQSAENAGLTRTGMMLGSPLYMSPEQARGSKNIDHRADIWSLGVVLYQCLCGRTPFQHVDALGELIMAICSERPPPVQDFAPWVSPEVAAIVHKSLQLRADDRYQTAAEMYDAVRALLPNGWAGIQASALVSLSETQRAVAQRRLTLPPSGPQSMFPQSMSSPSLPPPPHMPGGISGVAGTTGGVSGSMRESMAGTNPGTRSGSSAILVGSVALGVVVAGTIGFYALRGVIMPPPPAPAAQAAPAPVPTPAPVDTTPVTTVTPAPNDRSVKLVVIPDDAKVTVDGQPVKVKNGVVEISGPLGSVHKVKLSSGKQEAEEDVVVTEIGAQPPKVAVDPVAAGLPKVGGPLGPKKDADPAKTGAPAAPAGPKPGIETKFE